MRNEKLCCHRWMDCVTPSVSCQLLHNYRNKLLKKSRTPKWWSYRVTVDWHVVNSYDASTVVGVVNKLSHRRVLLTTQSTCRGKYCTSRICVKVPEESTLIFRGTQISLQHSVGQMDGSSMPKPASLGIAILGSRTWRSRPHFQSQNLGTECWSSKSQEFGIEKQDLGLLNWLHKDITNNYNFTLIIVFFACNIIYTWHTLQIYVWPTGIFFTLSHYRSSKKSSCSRPMDTTLNTKCSHYRLYSGKSHMLKSCNPGGIPGLQIP